MKITLHAFYFRHLERDSSLHLCLKINCFNFRRKWFFSTLKYWSHMTQNYCYKIDSVGSVVSRSEARLITFCTILIFPRIYCERFMVKTSINCYTFHWKRIPTKFCNWQLPFSLCIWSHFLRKSISCPALTSLNFHLIWKTSQVKRILVIIFCPRLYLSK